MYGFPALSCLRKGWRERRDKTSGEKMLVYIFFNWGVARGDSFKVEVGEVDGPKEGVRRDNGVEEKVHTGKGSDKAEGGTEDRRRSPPAVPRTRRSTSVA
jgi:hypothetical protein